MSNSVDPDEMAHYEPSHLDLRCLEKPILSPLAVEELIKHMQDYCITKTCLYNFDPLKPHFYIVKLGFTRVYIIFLISAQTHRLWVLVRTASARRF